jgi:hypothetical protein
MRKLVILGASIAALAVPTAAMAAPINAADGWTWDANAASQGIVGQYTSPSK